VTGATLNAGSGRVGVVGLGQMGSLMARSLAARGWSVDVYDVFPEAVERMAGLDNIDPAGSASEVGERSDVVLTSVYSPDDVEFALLDPEAGVLAGQQPGKIAIDTSTNSLECTAKVVAAYEAKGVAFLAAPVSGRAPHLTMMVGGDRAAYDGCVAVLAGISDRTIFLGDATAACMAKHINQFLTYVNFLVASEGLVAGAKAGIPLEALATVLEGGSGNSFMLPFALMGAIDRIPPVSPAALRMVAKDVRLAAASLKRIGVPSQVLALVNQAYDAAEGAFGAEPFPVMVRVTGDHYGLDPPFSPHG
jgi:3-hydroxyisobutyrate dehydrogenase